MSEATTTPTVGRVPAYIVSYRTNWTDAWTVATWVYPESIQLATGPSISSAVLLDNYGTIKRESAVTFSAYDPIDLKNQFVKIETVDDPGDIMAVTPVFYGFVPAEELRPHESPDGQASGDYLATAYGLEYLLDISNYAASWVIDGATTGPEAGPVSIHRVIPFNDRYTYGLTPVGNRTKDKVETESGEGGEPVEGTGHHVFSNDNEPWTARDICEYVLRYYTDPRVTFTLTGQVEILDNVIPSNFNPDLLTAFDILNAMIDRRRGAGWYTKVDGDTVSIEVFSLLGVSVVEGAITIPANESPITVNLDTLADIEDVSLNIETVSQYDRIVARGAKVKTVFSIHKYIGGGDESGGGGLLPAWTTEEQDTYDALDDDQRDSDAYRHIYTTFSLPINAKLNKNSNPQIDDTGTPNFAAAAAIRSWGLTFMRQLPILKTWADTEAQPEYREPFAFVKDPATGRYHYAERLNTSDRPSLTLRMLESHPGFELVGHYNHILGFNHFDGESSKPALFDYRDTYVTVAAETDSHVYYAINLSTPARRVLTIDVPDAELWVLSKGTALDIKADGTLDIEAVSSVLRTDADRLRGIATVARAWYGVQRGSLNLQMGQFVTFATRGDYIVNTISGNYSESVESVVSRITYDCLNHKTTIQTAYEELDFQRLDR